MKMNSYPDFMKNALNAIPSDQQNTSDIEGYYFEGKDGSQAAFWTCSADRQSKKHIHDFDEYMVFVSGQYIAYMDNQSYILNPGDELFIPKGTEQWGECIAGTRTIHVFGGRRINSAEK